MTLALLALALASYAWFLKGEALLRRWRGPMAGRARVERLRRWVARGWLLFGAVPLVALALLGQVDTLRRLPDAFVPLALAVRTALIGQGDPAATGLLAAAVAGGLAGGAGVGLLIAAWRRRRGRGDLHIGRIGGLLPRSCAELRWGAAVAITAGIVEELFFRLLLPLLVTQASGSALVGFGLATLLFGLAHGYQRLAGMVAATLVGGLFAALYLYSGALWLAMLAHVLLDLNSLVLRPAFAGAWRERH
ncbi:CPBP family intramembrane glutamic endopeptidase [Sphingomonas desiccabilis]|uniref:CPBP family intramembrane metalloprotease n=1 Tax=Sphingomonas desiccabilis TaxID=429134 RepID=A0A4Q2IT06_9SPHN|nr:CPBP family intramembrane glutamic endopeptidase [Sphingomonas desiccabilis]MBB3911756.1 membrane protease YdiL (CAAX protease family) [Sphingomonas desiccabilis]RXZ31521.1 CPBP family intramembrane metalloprotease [Sphingomonas desiccabilis]